MHWRSTNKTLLYHIKIFGRLSSWVASSFLTLIEKSRYAILMQFLKVNSLKVCWITTIYFFRHNFFNLIIFYQLFLKMTSKAGLSLTDVYTFSIFYNIESIILYPTEDTKACSNLIAHFIKTCGFRKNIIKILRFS